MKYISIYQYIIIGSCQNISLFKKKYISTSGTVTIFFCNRMPFCAFITETIVYENWQIDKEIINKCTKEEVFFYVSKIFILSTINHLWKARTCLFCGMWSEIIFQTCLIFLFFLLYLEFHYLNCHFVFRKRHLFTY